MIGIYVIQDNQFKYVSDGWTNITGYSKEETMDRMNPRHTIYTLDLDRIKSNINKRLTGAQKTIEYKFSIKKKDGTLVKVKVLGNQIDYNGKPAIAGTMIDITQQSLIEEELKESEEKYRGLIENSLVGIYILQNNKVKYANQYFCDIFGYKHEEIIDKLSPNELVHHDDKKRVKENIEKRITGQTDSMKYEFKGLKKDNSIIYIKVLGSRMNYKGEPAIMGILIDITELKEVENALKESENLFKMLINLAPLPITVMDDLFNHIIVNNSFCELFNLSKSECIGKNPYELGFITDEKSRAKIEEQIQSQGRIDNVEFSLQKEGTEKKDLLYSALRFKLKNAYLRLNTFIDITERNKINQELVQHRNHLEELVKQRTTELNIRNKELKNTNIKLKEQKKDLEKTLNALHTAQQQLIQSEKMASLGFLSAGIAHEINNPLNFIHGGSIALENYFEENTVPNNDEAHLYINAIKEGVKRTADIVNGLNHYCRSNDTERTPCQINNIVNHCLTILHNQIKGNIKIKKDLIDGLPIIQGNEGKLHQVFLNIINNSIQATNTKDGEIHISTLSDNENIFINVFDNGTGIPKKIINHVFDPFFTTKEPGKGTGLGLSISYNIIKEHNGTIAITSEPNKWTKLEIKLPIKPS